MEQGGYAFKGSTRGARLTYHFSNNADQSVRIGVSKYVAPTTFFFTISVGNYEEAGPEQDYGYGSIMPVRSAID